MKKCTVDITSIILPLLAGYISPLDALPNRARYNNGCQVQMLKIVSKNVKSFCVFASAVLFATNPAKALEAYWVSLQVAIADNHYVLSTLCEIEKWCYAEGKEGLKYLINEEGRIIITHPTYGRIYHDIHSIEVGSNVYKSHAYFSPTDQSNRSASGIIRLIVKR